MKVFDLQCEAGHGFEGWFGSEEDYQSQCTRGLLTCPLCGSAEVVRLPSAPRLNLSAARAAAPATRSAAPVQVPAARPVSHPAAAATPERQQAEAIFLQAVRHVLAHTEDVGPRFAEEARRIHYHEAPERTIRGVASVDECAALQEEGIDVLRLPRPKKREDLN